MTLEKLSTTFVLVPRTLNVLWKLFSFVVVFFAFFPLGVKEGMSHLLSSVHFLGRLIIDGLNEKCHKSEGRALIK